VNTTRTDAAPDTAALVEGLRRYERLVELRASRFWVERRAEIERLLSTPLTGGPDAAPPAPPRALRLAQWNVEKGLRFDAIARALESDPTLAGADVVFLNEVDLGCARSGNRHVARELAERREMYWAFAPAHLELTKGVGADLDAPGENAVGLQGNAILSRYPLGAARVVALPVCFEPYNFHEKRYGRRVAVLARVATAAGTLDLAGTHLEVRDTPACRARQMRAVVDALPSRGPAVLAGDLNTSTFARGTLARTAHGTARLLGDERRLRAALVDPTP
jgi:endonuclease/exonuclease/phosphatase family metal-dependent hydrolase